MASRREAWGSYWLGMGALITVSALKVILTAWVDVEFTALIFAPAILIAAGLGGLAPGAFITALSLPLVVLLTDSVMDRPTAVDLMLFALVGFGIAFLGGSLRDARHRAEQSSRLLQRRESYLQSILDSVSDATIAIRGDGGIISFNDAAERLFGYREKDILSRNITMLLADGIKASDNPFLAHPTSRKKRGVDTGARVVTGMRKDGTTFPMSVEIARSVSGDEVIITGFVRDITEYQKAASELEAAQADAVRQSRLNEMGEMTSALAHEINQPLAAIANYVQGSRRMLDRFDPSLLPQLRESLGHATTQTLRAGSIIHHMRDFVTRGETGKEIIDLERLVRDGAAMAMIGTKDIAFSLRLEISPIPASVLADSIQIQQVMVNLIRNAVDALRTQPIREIEIFTRVSGEDAWVEVSDTGHGIAPELAPAIFKPFVTSKTLGMGIGLSISKRIIESHGGTIAAYPRSGGGTTLTFSLPLVDQEAYADDY